MRIIVATIATALYALGAQAQAPAVKTIKMQSSWPASNTLQEHFKMFGERMDKLTQGAIKIEAMPGGQIVPPFEVLDATNKKVLDAGHSICSYGVGKSPRRRSSPGLPAARSAWTTWIGWAGS